MSRILLAVALLLGLSGCESRAVADPGQVAIDAGDEQAERQAVFDKVRAAIAAKDFAGLSALEVEFRSNHATTSSGTRKLELFHAGVQAYLSEGLTQEAKCEYRDESVVQQWAAATPDNPAPSITAASLLLQRAWCFRGTGYADTVAPGAWPKFRQGVIAASQALEADKAVASADPEFYAVKLEISRALGVGNAEFRATLDEAVAREPDYHRTYYKAIWFYLPQWGGSFEAVDKFARYAANKTYAKEKSALYARLYWSLSECNCDIIKNHADWPTMKQSMRDIFEAFPTKWNGYYSLDIACRMGDVDEGHRYVRLLNPQVTDDRSLAALFSACDKRARMSAERADYPILGRTEA